MSDREPSLIALLLLTALEGLKTIGEIASLTVFICSILLLAKLVEPERAAAHCVRGNTFSDCPRR